MQLLPTELLPIILDNLTKADLAQCMRVCKLWYSLVAAVYFEDINLSHNLKGFVELTEKPRIDGSMIGDFTKKLTIDIKDQHTPFSDEPEFFRLLENLPRLEAINTSHMYMFNLQRAPKHLLKNIQEVSQDQPGMIVPHVEDQFILNMQLRDQITTLKLRFSNIIAYGNKFLNVLTRFSQLKSLSITDGGERQVSGIHLMSILKVCKNLEHLYLTRSVDWDTTFSKQIIHSNLESLTINFRGLTTEHLQYFPRYLHNLKTLNSITVRGNIENLLLEMKPEDARNFTRYLRNMRQFKIKQHSPESVRLSAEEFRRFIKDVSGEGCRFKLNFYFVSLPAQVNGVSITKKDKDICMQFRVLWNEAWIKQLDYLALNSLSIVDDPSGYGIDDDDDEEDDLTIRFNDIYGDVLVPLFNILKKQQNRPVCSPLYVILGSQELILSMFACTLKSFKLQNSLLHTIGHLYPLIECLVLEHCEVGKENGEYCIDISPFNNIQELILDVDTIFRETNVEQPISIKIINIVRSASPEYYFCDLNSRHALYYLGEHNRADILGEFIQLNIHHSGIERFTFKRNGKVVKLTEEDDSENQPLIEESIITTATVKESDAEVVQITKPSSWLAKWLRF